jgi:antitoxin (DNA-binding transcriptional repressor) of toxin-antitoxin stability system
MGRAQQKVLHHNLSRPWHMRHMLDAVSELPIPESWDHFSEMAHEAAAGEVIYLTQRGHRLAALVSVDVAAEIEAAEDADDIRAAQAALAEPGPNIPLDEVFATYAADLAAYPNER